MIAKKNPANVLKWREELPSRVKLIVVSRDPEKTIRKVFQDYTWIEAAGGIVKRKKKALFIERLGYWDLPKGKIDAGERPAQAAIREIEEECGIKGAQIEQPIAITFHTYVMNGEPVIKKNWWYVLSYDGPKALIPQTEESITKAEWLEPSEWEKVRENTYPSILEVLNRYENSGF